MTYNKLRVARTYTPDHAGAKRYARRYGDKLVCVRHRLNEFGTERYTTVELLVDTSPVEPRNRTMADLRIAPEDRQTRAVLMACAAVWLPKERICRLQRLVSKQLGLLHLKVTHAGVKSHGDL